MNIFSFIREVFGRLTGKNEKYALEQIVPTLTQTQLEEWVNLYSNAENNALSLPSVIASEFARLALFESKITISKNDFINNSLSDFYSKLQNHFETACALGGMAFKPYISGDKILVDFVRADCFTPVSFSADTMTAAAFIDRKSINGKFYTRFEYHEFNAGLSQHTITNRVYVSDNSDYKGIECSLDSVPEWADLQPETTIANVKRPLFAYFKIPFVNSCDLDSPLGASVFANSVELIKQAGEMWERIQWEYEGTELAVDASLDVLNGKVMDKHNKRLYRAHDVDTINGSMFDVFSPAIRDTSLFNGLNKILQRIEFNCGLAYGTISEPADIEKTATEILSAKQRSYTHVTAIQRNLQAAIEHLVYAMSVYAKIYGLAGDNCEVAFEWGDSVLEDNEKEFQRRLQLVSAGILKKEKFIAWYFGCDEAEATEYIPQTSDLFGGDM